MSTSDTGNFASCPNCGASYDVTGFEPGKIFKCQLCDSKVEVGTHHFNVQPGSGTPTRSSPPSTSGSSPSGPKPSGSGSTGTQRSYARSSRKRTSGTFVVISIIAVLAFVLIVVLQMNGGKSTSSGTETSSDTSSEKNVARNETDTSNRTSADSTGENTTQEEPKQTENQQNTAEQSFPESSESNGSGSSAAAPSDNSSSTSSGASGTDSSNNTASTNTSDGKKENGGNQRRKKPKPVRSWNVDQTITDEILREFDGAPSMSFDKLRSKRKKLIDKYRPKKLIPAAIQAILDTDSDWKADQANKILKALLDWSSAPTKMKALNPEQINHNGRNWKKYWLHLNYEQKQKEMQAEQRLQEMAQEIKPFCDQASSGLPSQKQEGTRKVREKGEKYVPALIELLKGKYGDASKGAHHILKTLTGKDFGSLPSSNRSKYIEKWKSWWRENKDSFSYD